MNFITHLSDHYPHFVLARSEFTHSFMSLSPSIRPKSLSCWCGHVSFLRTVTLALLSKILKLLQFKKPTYLFISAGCSECFVATIFLFTSDYSAAVIFVPGLSTGFPFESATMSHCPLLFCFGGLVYKREKIGNILQQDPTF